MAEWTIYSISGVAKATVKELELHDEWMAECFITVSVKSAEPIDFAVGDYIDYRNERYSINYDPSKIKRARRGTYGEGFVYDNIKFVAVQDELVRCDFCDIVLSDNNIHYTQLSTFPFYCETVDDLLDRIQANMEDLYPGSWIIISPDLNRDKQRGLCVDREQAFIDAYNKYIGEGSEFTYEKTGVALTVDNINCWDALAKVNTDFALNFIVRDRIVIVGTAGVFTPKKFRYGKGNGLYELEVIGDSEQKVVTRLRAYGSEQNLPDRYYAERNLRVFSTVTDIYAKYGTDSYTGIAFFTDLRFSAKYFTYRSQSYPGTSDRPNYIVRMSAHGHEVTGYVSTDYSSDYFYIYSEYKNEIVDDRDEENREEMEAFTRDLEVGDKVYFTAYVEKGAFDAAHTEASATALPDNMAVNKLMLPGFPDMSLDEWVRENRPELIEEGFTFSTNSVRPYIDSPNKERYGIRPSNIFFDGSSDTDDIHPTLEGMTWDGHPCDEVVEAQQIEDNGVLSDNSKETDKRVTITIPYAGFKLNEEWVDGATISMKDGMCGARDFKILKKPTQDDYGNWICVCERAYDSVLKMYFPYSDFEIHTGDKFVLTGIDLPDSYIEAASVKLFDAAMDALRKNHLSRVTYQPKIDHIWMAHQHDTAMASGGAIESLHDTLKAGDYFSFADEDLNIDASIIIDILTIKEHADSGLATYEITLRDEKVVSALEKRLEKIVSDASGNGGSYSMRQTGSLVEQIGSELFLSKIEDDEAAGSIGFLKSAWFGAKQWFIDNTGSANLFNATINGLLKAYTAVINTVKSTNYTGEGMLDTGWLVTNAYGGTNSKAVFDFLYIRKKALFEELEIRKISHIGGDFALSPASGRAYRVEYYDAEGNQLGVEEMQVPWMLGYKVMMLFSKSKANKYLGHLKKIDRALKPEEKNLVKRVRVYLFSDDGTTQTMSNWTVGAQARCQSFNIEKQMEYHGSGEDSDNPDVGFWTGKKVENTYWWRLVSAVGKGTLSDGKTHDYIEFLANTGNDYDVADIGSDLPAVGDEFAQFGHRTRPELSNVIMLETARGDSPAIKLYTGINSWDLTGKRVSCISPEMTEFMANRFRLTTDYNSDVQLNDRGLWIDIPTEHILVELPDTWGDVRKCYYNDIVSHNGKWWVCTLASGTHKEDENGHWYTQAELDWLIVHDIEKYASLIDVENYTTLEPGDATLQQKTAWTEKTDYLVQVARLEFSNPMFVGAGQHVSTVTLKVSNLSAIIDNVIVEDSEGEVTWNGSQLVCNASVNKNRKVKVTAHGILNGMTYTASDVICVYRVASSYSSSATPSTFAFAQNENYPYAMNIDGVEVITEEREGEVIEHIGNSCTEIKVMGDGAEQPFRITGVTCVGYSDEGEQHREPGISCSYNNVTGRAWFVLVSNKMVKGKMTVSIAYGNGQTRAIEVPFASSLNGTWVTEIENDTLRQVAEKSTVDIYDDEGHYVKTVTVGEFTRSSSEDTMKLTKTTEYQAGQLNGDNPSVLNTKITTTNTRIDTADASIQTLTKTTEYQAGQLNGDNPSMLNTKITNTNTRVSTAEGNVSELQKQMSGETSSGLKVEITKTNTRVETADGNISTLQSQMAGTTASGLNTKIVDTNTRVDDAQGSINTVKHDLYDDDGLLGTSYSTSTQTAQMIKDEVTSATADMVKHSEFKMTDSGFTFMNKQMSSTGYADSTAEDAASDAAKGVENKLKETGIIIDGDNREVKLVAGKVSFCDSSGTKQSYVQITNDGKIKATDGEFSGKITASSGSITGDITIGTVGNKMQIYTDETVGTYKKSGIHGVNDNTTLLDLGFGDNNYPMLLLRAPSWTGSPITTQYPGFTSYSYGNYSADFGMNSLGQIRIYAPKAAWPSRNQVGVGSVFVGEDEVLRVRLS